MLSDSVNDLQELIGNLVVAGAFGGSHSLYELQSLDRISQGLDAISDYLVGAAKLSSPEWKIDVVEASASVKLAEISERLSGIKREDASAERRRGLRRFRVDRLKPLRRRRIRALLERYEAPPPDERIDLDRAIVELQEFAPCQAFRR